MDGYTITIDCDVLQADGGEIEFDAALSQLRQRQHQGHKAARDRCHAGAAIGLEHIAIDCDGVAVHGPEIDRRPQRAPDQALNLLAATAGIAAGAGVGGARQHGVFGRDPAAAALGQKRRH